jgi:hypothetical protein
LKDIQRAFHIRVQVRERIGKLSNQRNLPCDMTHCINSSSEDGFQLLQLADVAFEVFGRRRDVFPATGTLVIDNKYLMICSQKFIREVGADKPSPACYQHSQANAPCAAERRAVVCDDDFGCSLEESRDSC